MYINMHTHTHTHAHTHTHTHTRIHIYRYGGVRAEIVTVVVNEHGDTSSKP